MKYNATTDADSIVCIFPISGQYAILTRVLFYAMLFSGVVAIWKRWTWVILAAWAYIIPYSTAVAVHLWVMVATRKKGFYNLDFAAAWAMISTASLVAIPVDELLDSPHNNHYKGILHLWALVIHVSCCIVFFVHGNNYPLEPACWSAPSLDHRTLLTKQSQLLVPGMFNCTYKCFSKEYPTRDRAETTVIMAERAFGKQFELLRGAVAMVLGLLAGGVVHYYVGKKRRMGRSPEEMTPGPSIVKCGTTEARALALHVRGLNAVKRLKRGRALQPSFLIVVLCSIALPIAIELNETYLLGKQPLPVSEHAYAVGQWAPCVSMAVVLMAAAIKTRHQPGLGELRQNSEGAECDRGEKDSESITNPQVVVAGIDIGEGTSNNQPLENIQPLKNKRGNTISVLPQLERVHTN